LEFKDRMFRTWSLRCIASGRPTVDKPSIEEQLRQAEEQLKDSFAFEVFLFAVALVIGFAVAWVMGVGRG
jgi:hypothetical protein